MNRNCLVTGAAQGIGLQICREILIGGGKVFMTDINTELGEESKEKLAKEFGGPRVGFSAHDITDKEGWRVVWEKAEHFFEGKVEALCNNAGIFHKTAWEKVLDINMMGTAYGTMLAIEKMGASRGGQGGLIVQTASIAGFVAGFPTIEEGAYTASKHGVVGYTRAVANTETYVVEKVRIVALCPWFVDTSLVRNVESPEEIKKKMKMRVLTTEEVGVAFSKLWVQGESGDCVVVLPGFSFFWPNWNRKFVVFFGLAAKFLIKVLGHNPLDPVTSQQFLQVGLFFLLLLGIIFHILLSWLGF